MEKSSLVLTPNGTCSILEAKQVYTLSGVSVVKDVMLVDRPCYEVELADGSFIILGEDTIIFYKKWSPLKPQNWRITTFSSILPKKGMVLRKNPDYGLRIENIIPLGIRECVKCATKDGTLILENQIVIGVSKG